MLDVQMSATPSLLSDLCLTSLDDRRAVSVPATSASGDSAPSTPSPMFAVAPRREGDLCHNDGRNNSSQDHHICPEMSSPCDIGPEEIVEKRVACRMTLRPDRFKYVTLNFRFMRHDAEMHVGQIVNLCKVRRSDLYTPKILDRWTQKLTVKLRSTVKVSVVFKSISARIGLQSTVGIKYCLDGFYGMEAFGDAFGNIGLGVCPWMEVTGEGSPLSLHLEDSDNIYVSVANDKMAELVRLRAQQVAEHVFKQGQARLDRQHAAVSVRSARHVGDSGESIGPKFKMQPSQSQDTEIVELVL